MAALAVLALCAARWTHARTQLGMERVTTEPEQQRRGRLHRDARRLPAEQHPGAVPPGRKTPLTHDDDGVEPSCCERHRPTRRECWRTTPALRTRACRSSLYFASANADAVENDYAGAGRWTAAGRRRHVHQQHLHAQRQRRRVPRRRARKAATPTRRAPRRARRDEGRRPDRLRHHPEAPPLTTPTSSSHDILSAPGRHDDPPLLAGRRRRLRRRGSSSSATTHRQSSFAAPRSCTQGADTQVNLYARDARRTVEVKPGDTPFETRISGV